VRSRVVAPLLAAVLGLGGGVVTALAVGDGGDEPAASSYNDPLHLGIPLVDQDCSGESLLVVGYGDSGAPLGSAVANHADERLRYLRSEDSCPTLLGPENKPAPAYVVYRGPYDTRSEPCAVRMSGDYDGGFVTVLKAGNTTLVKCVCELPYEDAPVLRVGMAADQRAVVWTRAVQGMLNDYDRERFPRSAITGRYDETTADRVTEVFAEAPGVLTTPGVLDEAGWRVVVSRICRIYEY
jgi:hypothetical protein